MKEVREEIFGEGVGIVGLELEMELLGSGRGRGRGRMELLRARLVDLPAAPEDNGEVDADTDTDKIGELGTTGGSSSSSFQFQSTVSAYVNIGMTPNSRDTPTSGTDIPAGMPMGFDWSCVAEWM